MHADDLILVSVDDHLVEPPDMFEGRVPARYRDVAPRVERRPDGSDVWSFNGAVIPNIGLNAVAGRPKEEYGVEPTAFDEMRPGCYDVHERIKDMNAGGVLASMCFPSFPGFSGRLFAACEDKSLALAMVQAYNDWHIEDWCGAYPGRFIPMALPVLWDPELAAAEVRRVAAKGCHSVTFTENPATLGYPSFHDASWDPFWKAVCDEGVVVSVHLGSSGKLAVTAPDAPVDVMITLQPMNICSAAADLLWSRVIKEFPDIKIALSEGGTGWIPYFLDRLDRTYDMHRAWTGQDFGDKVPSDVFREHFLTCFIADPVGIELRHTIGIDNIAWECDYPHSDSSWPEAPEELAERRRGRSRRRAGQDHLRERLPLVPLRPVRAPRPRGVHRRRAAPGGGRSRRLDPVLRQGSVRALPRGHRHRPTGRAGDGVSEDAASTDDTILLEQKGGELWITLNRPDAANALTPAQRNRLIDFSKVRVPTPRSGSSYWRRTVDISAPAPTSREGRESRRPWAPWPACCARVHNASSPRCSTARNRSWPSCTGPPRASVPISILSCDFVVASDNARLIEVFARRGLVPDGGGAYLLPRLVGPMRAKELMMLADDVSAERARDLGLVTSVVGDEQLRGAVEDLAARLAAAPTRSLSLSKWLVNRSLESSRDQCFADEAVAQEQNMGTRDAQEGVAAFVERRTPAFEGR